MTRVFRFSACQSAVNPFAHVTSTQLYMLFGILRNMEKSDNKEAVLVYKMKCISFIIGHEPYEV